VLIKQTDVARNEASSIGVDYTGATLFSGSYDPGLPFAAGSTYAVGTDPGTAGSTLDSDSAWNNTGNTATAAPTYPDSADSISPIASSTNAGSVSDSAAAPTALTPTATASVGSGSFHK